MCTEGDINTHCSANSLFYLSAWQVTTDIEENSDEQPLCEPSL